VPNNITICCNKL
jgi:hypothetical protein